MGLVDVGEDADIYVSMLAWVIKAKSSVTQVLFFKLKAEDVALKTNTAKVSLNRSALADLQPIIRAKVRAYQHDYVSSIKDI